MNKDAVLHMFADAFGLRLRKGLYGRHRKHVPDQFEDIADGIHSPNISVYYPKGSKAKKPVCALIMPIPMTVAAESYAAVFRKYPNVSGYNVYIMEAGYVNVARACEAARIRSED